MAKTGMSIAELEEHLAILAPRKTVLVEGPHGCGKTEWAINYGERNGFATKVWHPSHAVDGSDVSGLPHKNLENKTTELFPPDWLAQNDGRKRLLIIDETNRAIGLVQNALMQLTNNGTYDNVTLPEGSRIICLINPYGDGHYEVNSFDDAQEDRFWRCTFSPTPEEWFTWVRAKGDADERVIRYLEKYTSNLDPYDNEDLVGRVGNANNGISQKRPSRRSWYQCATDIKRGESIGMWAGESGRVKLINHVAGYVGINLAIDYATWHYAQDTFDVEAATFGDGIDEIASEKLKKQSIEDVVNTNKTIKSCINLFASRANDIAEKRKAKDKKTLEKWADNLFKLIDCLDPEAKTLVISTLIVPELEAGKRWITTMTSNSPKLTNLITESQSEQEL